VRHATISDRFEELIGHLKVEAALFTTYTLEIGFFETEVVPLLLRDGGSYSNDIRIKEIQVRERLQRSGIAVDLFYDASAFKRQTDSSVRSVPAMEYGFYPVEVPGGVFHAKTILVLGTDTSGVQQLVLITASCNLTKAGWWDNIELMHGIVLSPNDPPSAQIYAALTHWLEVLEKSGHAAKQAQALARIKVFLETLETDETAFEDLFLYTSHTPFPQFLQEHLKEGYRTVEIVSPYFAESPSLEWLDEIHARKATIYLPTQTVDEKRVALCSADFYSDVRRTGAVWSTLSKELMEKIDKEGARRLHAKLFCFEDAKGEHWAFAGSVNFSHKAFDGNLEAGFLFKVPASQKLLEPLREDPQCFDEKLLLPEQAVEAPREEEEGCRLELLFDWTPKRKTVTLMGESGNKSVRLLDQMGTELFRFERGEGEYRVKEGSPLVRHLEKNSFVVVEMGGRKCERYVLQKNWTYKPLHYPDLTSREIIDIYATMNPQKSESYLISAAIRKLVQSGNATEYTRSVDAIRQAPDFFSAYAELFYAFRRLEGLCKESRDQKDYYLLSPRPDAVPSLLEQTGKEKELDSVMKYLVVLSAKELYEKCGEDFSPYIPMLEETRARFDDQKFVEWFEEEFMREYRIMERRDEA